jgi:hypothetical protein
MFTFCAGGRDPVWSVEPAADEVRGHCRASWLPNGTLLVIIELISDSQLINYNGR